MGIGAGAAMAGMGALFAGGGYLLKQIAEFDGKAVVENVKHLLSINDLFKGSWDALKEGGTFFLVMLGIGAGLVAFSAGAAVTAAVQYFTKGTKWAETVVKNVKTLIDIQDIKGYDSFGRANFIWTMGGIGLGLVAFSIGEVAASMATAFTQFSDTEDWAKVVVKNVTTLIGIQDIPGYDSFSSKDFLGTMSGIGLGLVAFAIGTATTSMAESLTKFSDTEDWAKVVVKNVTTLIGIQDVKGYDSFSADGFFGTMLGIGAGLVAFSIGKVAASTATAFTQFTNTVDWAKTVVSNVKTLVGIQFIKGYDTFGATGFAATMLGIAVGLVAFSLGEVVASSATAFTQFSGAGNWAQTIVDNVKTLVSISSIPNIGKDTAGFALVMGGIAAGLVAFAIGKGASGVAEAVTKFSGGGKEGDFADRIKKQVVTLLSILDHPSVDQKKADSFSSIMSTIADGLTSFAGGTFLSGLAGAATKVMSFLTGTESPIQQMEKIAKNAVELEKGATAIGSISENLDKVGNLKFKGGDLGIEEFAEDLLQSIPNIEVAIRGGKVSTGLFSGTTIKGLGSKDIPWEQAGVNLKIIHEALNKPKVDGIESPNKDSGNILWSEKLTKSIDGLTTALMAASGGAVNNVDASTKTQETKNFVAGTVKGGPNQIVLAMAGVYDE